MQICKDCGHDYNEFTSGTPASEHRCDDCSVNPDKLFAGQFGETGTCPKCGSKDLEGWTAGGQTGFQCANCFHDQTTKIDDTTYHRKHADKRDS